ncbi:uncharacterized protein LOC116057732 isoform X3 [Sander lucioperca]|uniref:uncharacterized protein LOC116057732 isoform X3 n=1 Tax=Sander lucioperca TaxID=283035 RepID=UPI00125E1A9A|nr:uncharacterized protein LOC116057732 isoform X3 [Sander lucioperca]
MPWHIEEEDDRSYFQEMCKVESSTDSDSEISPRWSDTSTMGCVSSTPESGTFHRTLPVTHKPAGRHGCYSLFLDPYDGSSEDSDKSNIDVGVSSRRTRQQGKSGGGGCRFSGRSRRFSLHHPASVSLREVVKNGKRDPVTEQQHLLDVQMKCESDSELCVSELDIMPAHSDRDGLTEEMANDSTMHTQTMGIELHCQFDDSDLHATRSSTPGPVTPVGGCSSQMLDSSSERPPCPCNLRSLSKRKMSFPGAEVVELGQRKRQCVVNMEDEQQQQERDSASEPC